MLNLLTHRVDWYRPTIGLDLSYAECIKDTERLEEDLPCCIQPASNQEQQFHLMKGSEITHTVYFESGTFQRNDRLFFGTRELVVVGSRDLIESGRVVVVDCKEYPSTGKAR